MAQTRNGISIDISGALKKIGLVEEEIKSASEDFVKSLTEEGARIARLALNDAETKYGQRRMKAGRGISAGRNDTGRMRNKLRALKVEDKGDGSFRGGVGWYYADEYFKYQERGTRSNRTSPNAYDPNFDYNSEYARRGGGIVGAHSLWSARKWMEDNLVSEKIKFLNRIRKAGK